MYGFDLKKAVQSLTYLALKEEGNTINYMKALKLIWLADRLHIMQYGYLYTGDTYFALKNGPVASGTYDVIKSIASNVTSEPLENGYVYNFLSKKSAYEFEAINTQLETENLSEAFTECLDAVHGFYGDLGEFELSDLSHDFPEWKKFEREFNSKNATRILISNDDFFIPYKDSTNLFNKKESVLSVVKEQYDFAKDIQSLFNKPLNIIEN